MFNIAVLLNLGEVGNRMGRKSPPEFDHLSTNYTCFTCLPEKDQNGLCVFTYSLSLRTHSLRIRTHTLSSELDYLFKLLLKPITALSPYQAEFFGLGPYELFLKKYLRPPLSQPNSHSMKIQLLSLSGPFTRKNNFWPVLVLTGILFITGNVREAGAQNCSVNSGVDQTICANVPLTLYGGKSGSFPGSPVTTWTQVGGPAAVITAPHNLTSTVTSFVGNTTLIFRLSTTCQDGSFVTQDVNYFVLPTATAYAGTDATYCPGAVAALNATAAGIGNTGVWTGSGNGVTVNDPNDPHSALTISGTAAGATTLRWTVSNVSGCSTYDDVVITNLGGETPVNAGFDQNLGHCYSTTQSTSLSGTYAGLWGSGQGGTWTIVSGPNVPAFSSSHSNTTSVTGLIEGTYVFRWTVVGTCISGIDEVTIVVPAPTANVTGASISGGNQVFCDGRISTVLTGNAPTYVNETGTWTQPVGQLATIESPNSPVTAITGLDGSSTYLFTYTINNSIINCSSSTGVSVSYLLNAPTINIVPETIVLLCGETSTTVPYTSSGSGVNQYSILSGPAGTGYTYPTAFINSGSSPQTISGLTKAGTYVVQMRRYTSVGVACGTQYDQVSITTSLGGALANAGTDQILDCLVTFTDLQGNDPLSTGTGEGTWSQINGPSTVYFAHPSNHNPTLTVTGLLTGSVYVFLWKITDGAGCPNTQDTVTVLTASIAPNVQSAGPDQDVCTGTPVYLHADPLDHLFELGTWTVSPSAGVTIANINSNITTVTGMQPFMTYTFTWTIANGCGSVSDFMLVNVNDTFGPIASAAGSDQCLASGSTGTTLNGNNPSPGTGLWTLAVGSPPGSTITTPTAYNSKFTGLTTGTYTLTWSISRGGCPDTRDTVLVTVNDPDATAANAGTDVSVCGTSTSLTATGSNPAAGSTAQWTQVSGSGGVIIGTPNAATTTLTGLTTGGSPSALYKFRYAITNGGCVSADTVSVFVSEATDVANIALASTAVCGATTVDLTADAITSGSGMWSIVSGPNLPSIVSPSSASTTVNSLITGNYVFRWTVSGGVYCSPTSDDISVAVTLTANAGSDQSHCEAITAVSLTGTTASSGTWSQVSGTYTATITPTSANTATASGLSPGVYTFRYTISAIDCASTDDMTVTLYSPPSIAVAGADQTWCSESVSTFTMDATTPLSGTGTWTKLFGPTGATGSFDDASLINAVYTPATNKYGVYVFQWTVANSTCSNADQVRITYYQEPSAAVAGATQNLTCATSATMAATDPAVGVGTWTLYSQTGDSPTPVITNPLLYNSTITGLGPKTSGDSTTYTFLWTVTNGNCTPKTSTVKIRVYQAPTAAFAGTDQIWCEQTEVTLTATPVTVGSGNWTQQSPAVTTEVFTAPTSNSTTTVSGLIPGNTYVFRWTTTTAFCSSFDEVTITKYSPPSTAVTT
jgi:hypothetical protein